MTEKSEFGQLGEELACEYLVKKGYKIVERNFWRKWGELDIIAKAPDKTLVFIEVKAMLGFGGDNGDAAGLKPEDQLTQAKLRKLQRTAALYAGNYPELIKEKRGWRIDLVAITIDAEGEAKINHYENI